MGPDPDSRRTHKVVSRFRVRSLALAPRNDGVERHATRVAQVRCIGMTSPKPVTFMFKDDGKVPNNPSLPTLVYKAAVDFGGKDPARTIERGQDPG